MVGWFVKSRHFHKGGGIFFGLLDVEFLDVGYYKFGLWQVFKIEIAGPQAIKKVP